MMIDDASVAREARILAGIYKATISTDPGTFSNAFVYDALEWCDGFAESLCAPLLQLKDASSASSSSEARVNSILHAAAIEQGCAAYIVDTFLNVSELLKHGRRNFLMLLLTNPFVPDVVHAQVASLLMASSKDLDPGLIDALVAGREACVWIGRDPKEAEDAIIKRIAGLMASFDGERLQAVMSALASKSPESPVCLRISLAVIKIFDGKKGCAALSEYFMDAACGKDFLQDPLLDLPMLAETLSAGPFYDAVKRKFFAKISDVFRGIVAGGRVLPEEGSPESKLVCRLGKCYRILSTKDPGGSLRLQVERFGSIFKSDPLLHKYFEKNILSK